MARPFISRMLETFFRRKWLYLLPLVPFLALGVLTVLTTGDSWRSTGLVRVNLNTELDRINETANPLSGETAASYTARQFMTNLEIDGFLHMLMEQAGIPSNPDTDAAVKRSVWAAAAGDDLVTVNAATSDSKTSFDLARAAITTYPRWNVEDSQKDSNKTLEALDRQVAPLQIRHDEAQETLNTFTVGLPPIPEADLPSGMAAQLQSYRDQVESTREDLNAANANLTAARQTADQNADRINQQFREIDAPDEATAPEPRRKQDITTLAIFTILGLLVSGAALVVGTLMDRSVRFSDEIEAHLDVPVIATIPDSSAAVMPRIL